jgi:hypothetical protein
MIGNGPNWPDPLNDPRLGLVVQDQPALITEIRAGRSVGFHLAKLVTKPPQDGKHGLTAGTIIKLAWIVALVE